MLDGPVRARELGEVVARHLRLDLDRVEDLAVVDADDAADHLRDDDHVAQVGLDNGGLLVGRGLLLGRAQLLDEAHGLALEAAAEPAPGAGVDELWGIMGEWGDGGRMRTGGVLLRTGGMLEVVIE